MSTATATPIVVSFPRQLTSVRVQEAMATEPAPSPPRPLENVSKPEAPGNAQEHLHPGPSEELLRQIDASLAALFAYEQQQRTLLRQTTIELAIVAAETVLGHAMQAGDYDIGSRVDQALATFGGSGPLRIGLNPTDLETARNALAESSHAVSVQLEASVEVPPGECHVGSPHESFCSDMSTQLESIRRTWLEAIHDAAH